jgi:hypothetical protein
MDSSGPDVKVRGTAAQIYDKYVALARDAASSGNRVKAENYRQHGEHYLRLVNAQEAAKQAAREEAEAARAERGESEDPADEKNQTKGQERRGRRYPPKVRRDKDNQNSDDVSPENSDSAEATSGDEDAAAETKSKKTPKVEDPAEDKPEASTRRRKAPSRKPADDETIEAAE